MNKKNQQKIYNKIRRQVINSKRQISFSEISKHNKHFLDFMLENFEIDHIEVIDFMCDEKTKQMIAQAVPPNAEGYVQIYVRKVDGLFKPFIIEFIPYRIIHKFWGLGYKNVNIKDFIFYECLYENDHTIFRGSLLN